MVNDAPFRQMQLSTGPSENLLLLKVMSESGAFMQNSYLEGVVMVEFLMVLPEIETTDLVSVWRVIIVQDWDLMLVKLLLLIEMLTKEPLPSNLLTLINITASCSRVVFLGKSKLFRSIINFCSVWFVKQLFRIVYTMDL